MIFRRITYVVYWPISMVAFALLITVLWFPVWVFTGKNLNYQADWYEWNVHEAVSRWAGL